MASDFALTTLESPAIADVLQERLAQVERRNHTPDHDNAQAVDALAKLACEYGLIARDRAHPGERQTLPGARKKAVQAAALWLAQIDRIDAELAKLPPPPDPDAPEPMADLFIPSPTEQKGNRS